MRKIIQIQAPDDGLVALCDDGTTWYITEGGTRWVRYLDIPQDESPSVEDAMPEPQGTENWPPKALVGLWHLVDGQASEITCREIFWIVWGAREKMVEACYPHDALKMLLDPSSAPEQRKFTYEGHEFTVPSDPIPF